MIDYQGNKEKEKKKSNYDGNKLWLMTMIPTIYKKIHAELG